MQPGWFVPIKSTCEPGEKAVFLVSSGYKNVNIFYEAKHKGEIFEKDWLKLSNGNKGRDTS